MVFQPKIPLNTLRAFESAARHGSFVRAGEELNVTAAAISHRVKDLETALGVPMFRRKARGIELTEAGRRFGENIADAFHLIERATARVDESAVEGPLLVSMPESFADLWLIPRLHRLADSVPGIELAIEADSSIASLRDGPADVGIRFGNGEYPELECEFLFGDMVTVLASTASVPDPANVSIGSIVKNNILLEDYRTTVFEPWMTWQPWLREAGLPDNTGIRKLRFSNSGLAVHACVENAGLCIGRMSLAFDRVRKQQLQPLFPWRSTEMAYHLVMSAAAGENPRVLAFRRWLLQEIESYTRDVIGTTSVKLPLPAVNMD